MTSLLDLLDAPAGTIATTTIDGAPRTVAVILTDGARRLVVQHATRMVDMMQIVRHLHGVRGVVPAIRQVHPVEVTLLPARPRPYNDVELDAADRATYGAVAALPIGAIIDASPMDAVLDPRGPGGAKLLTRISDTQWAPMEGTSPRVESVRTALAARSTAPVAGSVDAWVHRLIGDAQDADFTILATLAPWGRAWAGMPS